MLIRAVQLSDHPGIGNLFLRFDDASGHIFKTIVLAGGNGTGKTALLEVIQAAFEGKLGAQLGKLELHLLLNEEELKTLHSFSGAPHENVKLDVTLHYDSSGAAADGWHTAYQLRMIKSPSGEEIAGPTPVIANPAWQNFFRTFFSEASVNFSADALSTVTAMAIDRNKPEQRRSGKDLAKDITQLIIDIRAADAEDLALWVKEHPGLVVPNHVQETRFSRFRNAFEYMFPSKRFKRVIRHEGRVVVEFEEYGRISSINDLSTGEKQIVFRAGFLLRDLASTGDSIVMIDEPELSLHPDWQRRIVGFYTTLLSDSSGQHPQLIAATHSPFIVHGASNAKTIILQKDFSGNVTEMPSPVYPSVSGNEAVRAFNLDGFIEDAKRNLLVLTEGESDARIVKTAWEKLYPGKHRPFELRAALGAKNINITLNDQELFAKLGSRLIVGLFDFDLAYAQWKGVWSSKIARSHLVSDVVSDGIIKSCQTA
jgi:predicted ATPase